MQPMPQASSANGISKLSSLHKLKIKEVFCPVSCITVHLTPLTVGDDLSLRTMVSSPEFYDREIAALIYKHASFPESAEHGHPSFEQFISAFSVYDKRLLIYGIFSSTYKLIAEDTIKCGNCGHEFKDKIKTEEIIDVESFQVWDKDEPFSSYARKLTVDVDPETENGITSLTFITRIPLIKHQFDILSLIAPDKMKYNFEKTGSILSRAEELSLITAAIEVNSKVNGELEVDVIQGYQDVANAISNFITSDIVNNVMDDYTEEFDKYNPTFKKSYDCAKCGFHIDYPINIEANLFRAFFNV